MTEVKTPEPDTHCFDTDTGLDVWSYSVAQLKQYGNDRARDALEMAAKVCEDTDIATYIFAGQLYDSGAETLGEAINAIRALAKEIK